MTLDAMDSQSSSSTPVRRRDVVMRGKMRGNDARQRCEATMRGNDARQRCEATMRGNDARQDARQRCEATMRVHCRLILRISENQENKTSLGSGRACERCGLARRTEVVQVAGRGSPSECLTILQIFRSKIDRLRFSRWARLELRRGN
jgi:hypothetical protein